MTLTYEQDFLSCSYGYRKGVQIHDAVQELDYAIAKEGYQWVLEADIRGFFEHLDHEWVRKMLRERIADEWSTTIILSLKRQLEMSYSIV